MLTILFFLVSANIAILWSVIVIPFGVMGYKLHNINGLRMKTFLKKVKHASIWTNDEPDGWICGKWYIGYIKTTQSHKDNTAELFIFCSKDYFQRTIEMKHVDNNGKSNTITYYEREGSFWSLKYNSRPVELPNKPSRTHQTRAIDDVIDVFTEKGYCRTLLYGQPNTGKSWTAHFLCKKLLETHKEVYLVDTFNPFEHGDSFSSLYNKIDPKPDKPLVVLMEEIDINITKMHNQEVIQKEEIPVQIKNKGDWNAFLDRFDRDLYKNIIILMTTNQTKEYFDKLDESYMRSGRVDLKIQF